YKFHVPVFQKVPKPLLDLQNVRVVASRSKGRAQPQPASPWSGLRLRAKPDLRVSAYHENFPHACSVANLMTLLPARMSTPRMSQPENPSEPMPAASRSTGAIMAR